MADDNFDRKAKFIVEQLAILGERQKATELVILELETSALAFNNFADKIVPASKRRSIEPAGNRRKLRKRRRGRKPDQSGNQ